MIPFGWRTSINDTAYPRMEVSEEFARIQDPALVERTQRWMMEFFGVWKLLKDGQVIVNREDKILIMNSATWERFKDQVLLPVL